MSTTVVQLLSEEQNQSADAFQVSILSQWQNKRHFDYLPECYRTIHSEFEHIPWEKVDCMLTKMVGKRKDGLTFAFDMFPPQSAAKADLHVHPLSDRVITVVKGTGHAFVKTSSGKVATKAVEPGDMIIFPRGVPHAFWGSEEDPMVVHVVLNPYVPLEHPLHTVCPKKVRQLSDHPELQAMCDVGDLGRLAAMVEKMLAKGDIQLGERQQMGWGDDVVEESRKVSQTDKYD